MSVLPDRDHRLLNWSDERLLDELRSQFESALVQELCDRFETAKERFPALQEAAYGFAEQMSTRVGWLEEIETELENAEVSEEELEKALKHVTEVRKDFEYDIGDFERELGTL